MQVIGLGRSAAKISTHVSPAVHKESNDRNRFRNIDHAIGLT